MRTLERARGAAADVRAPRRPSATSIVEGVVFAGAVFCLVGFVVAAYFRLTFDAPLWIMETPTMQAIRRLNAGLPLYAPPTLDYVAPIYAPLYFVVSTVATKIVGTGLLAPRLISLVASLGSAALIAHLVYGETRRMPMAAIAAGLFISTTQLSYLSFDLARVDPLCLLLMLGGLATMRADRPLASGVLIGLAILTKQTAIALALTLLAIVALDRQPRAILAYVAGLIVTIGIGAAAIYVTSGDWASFYLIRLPRMHSLTLDQLGVFWTQKVLPGATILLVGAPIFFIGRGIRKDWRLVRFWLIAAVGMLGMAWVATLNRWSDSNVLLPTVAILSILGTLGLNETLRRLGEASPFRIYALALVAVEFLAIGYNPRASSPLRSDVAAVDRMIDTIRQMPGTVFAPDLSEIVYLAGKGDGAMGLSVLELEGGFGGKPVPEGSRWIADYRAALDQRRFDVLLLDPDGVEAFLTDEADSSGYVDTGPLFKSNDVFYAYGSHYAPRAHVWRPRERL